MKLTGRQLVLLVSLSLVLLIPSSPVQAAKIRIRSPKTVRAKTATGVSYSAARLSRPTHSIIVNFLNLTGLNRIEYSLSYIANGIPQGVVGSLPGGGGNQSRDLYFGTCSKGVCTPHYNIRNASLVVTAQLKNGATYSKRYRIKI